MRKLFRVHVNRSATRSAVEGAVRSQLRRLVSLLAGWLTPPRSSVGKRGGTTLGPNVPLLHAAHMHGERVRRRAVATQPCSPRKLMRLWQASKRII